MNGYEGLYIISNTGKIARLLHPKLNKDGYYEQGLAEAFIDNPDGLPEVNHIDENKSNNNVNNLEWCDHKYNTNHGTRLARISHTQRNRKDCSKQVIGNSKTKKREVNSYGKIFSL